MPNITFADLVEVYRATKFDGENGGLLTVSNERMAANLTAITNDDDLYADTQIAVEGSDEIAVGSHLRISVGSPNSAKFGLLVSSFEDLFRAPGAVISEPKHYYIKDHGFAYDDHPVPCVILQYRAVLNVLRIFREIASFYNETMREMIFIGKDKVVVPVQFGVEDLQNGVIEQADRLVRLFSDELHIDEKRTILQTTLIEMVRAKRADTRLGYLIRNLESLADEIEKGYRLFISSFSYSKIRNDVEVARLDFTGKIHKTIVDVQGQLLSIPAATIVVVSQLKQATGSCSVNFWANIGVLLGAWIFVAMLVIAGINQWKTLEVISNEIMRQKIRLSDDFAAVADQFKDVFDDLAKRVWWHRCALIGVCIILASGTIATTVAFYELAPTRMGACLAFWTH